MVASTTTASCCCCCPFLYTRLSPVNVPPLKFRVKFKFDFENSTLVKLSIYGEKTIREFSIEKAFLLNSKTSKILVVDHDFFKTIENQNTIAQWDENRKSVRFLEKNWNFFFSPKPQIRSCTDNLDYMRPASAASEAIS